MEEGELRRYILEAFRSMDQETRHISIEEMAALASRDLSRRRSKEIEDHLAQCALCRQQLQEYEQFVADAQKPATGDLTDEWKELQRRLRPKKIVTMRRWLPAIAAALILAAGLAWVIIDRIVNKPQPQLLLVLAYLEQRPFDWRVADAGHAPKSVLKGPADRPLALAEAEVQLKKDARKNPSDPHVLRLLGVAELLDAKPGQAIETLRHALELRPNDPEILADLGVAYALQGDTEGRRSDYFIASDYLGRSLQLQPRVPQARFNLALVLEKMELYDQALKAWQDYLNIRETDEGWNQEARERLEQLQAKLKAYEEAPDKEPGDPLKFIALPPASRVLAAETYLGEYAPQWLMGFNSNQATRQALEMLAEALKQHSDFWLAEIAASGMGPEMIAGFKKLDYADHQKTAQARLAAAREAIQFFGRARNTAGVLRARFSELVFLHAGSFFPECLAAADRLRGDLEPHRYARLKARVEIEHAICAMRVARLGEAETSLHRAIKIADEARFTEVGLNARSRYLSSLRHIGLRSDIFDAAHRLMDAFWEGTGEPDLFYQVTDELRDIATRDGQKYAALFLARSAVWATQVQSKMFPEQSESNVPNMASAEANLAVAAKAAGEDNEAQQNLKQAELVFGHLPEVQIGPETDFAAAELEHGELVSALHRLKSLEIKPGAESSTDAVNYYSTLGEAYRENRLLPEAKEAFLHSIELAKKRLASRDGERTGVLKSIEGSYRRLVAITLAGPGGSLDALRVWQEYQALDGRVNPNSIHPPSVPVLSYVEMPDGFVAWLVQGDQVTFHPLAATPEASKIATQFRRLCSDPQSNLQDLRRDAQQLYSWMIGPFAEQLNQLPVDQTQQRQLIVELDGFVAGIPMQALVAPDGNYLGDKFLVSISMGFKTSELRQETFSRETRALVIANPVVVGASATRFRSLAEDSLKEAAAIQNAFSVKPQLLNGREATITALQDRLSNVEIVHFSGHGYDNGENGALLFAPTDPTADYDPLRSSEVARQNWSRVRLVVLSACAAAAGETHGPHNPDSLVRALIRAGPPRVVAALWNVESGATQELMSAFYFSLGQGQPPAQALRTAQQKIQRAGVEHLDWLHPYYWAGFQLYGTT